MPVLKCHGAPAHKLFIQPHRFPCVSDVLLHVALEVLLKVVITQLPMQAKCCMTRMIIANFVDLSIAGGFL